MNDIFPLYRRITSHFFTVLSFGLLTLMTNAGFTLITNPTVFENKEKKIEQKIIY